MTAGGPADEPPTQGLEPAAAAVEWPGSGARDR